VHTASESSPTGSQGSAAPAVLALDQLSLPLDDRRDGKVRSSWALPKTETDGPRRLFVTSDRLSAFDRVVGLVPGKGQMLNMLAWWWFEQLDSIVANHALSVPDPAVLVAREASPLPVEVIVRRAITGVTDTSLWRRYNAGARLIDGHHLPDGLSKNELLPHAIITPTTKGAAGSHDVPLSVAEVAACGLVEPALWEQVCDAALQVFAAGERIAEQAGLILADTKYEFGLGHDGQLLLIDEVHTPDSSRFWERSTYGNRVSLGQEPESLDKEIIRRAFADLGYRGDGAVPDLDPEVWTAVAAGYQRTYERLTGTNFTPPAGDPTLRIPAALTAAGLLPESS
jgi:phosphoribosylaminoimidazole-succinocarboxamide synthase